MVKVLKRLEKPRHEIRPRFTSQTCHDTSCRAISRVLTSKRRARRDEASLMKTSLRLCASSVKIFLTLETQRRKVKT
jgi:hypothetical protein